MCTLDKSQDTADKPTDLILLDHVYDEVVKISGTFQASSFS